MTFKGLSAVIHLKFILWKICNFGVAATPFIIHTPAVEDLLDVFYRGGVTFKQM